MRLTLLFLILSSVLIRSDDEDSLWEELKKKAPQAYQMLKDKVSDAAEDWDNKEEEYSQKENVPKMLCEIDEDDDKIHKILKKLAKVDDKFKKLVKKIKKFFTKRKRDCNNNKSESDECICDEESNEAFCFFESVKDSYEITKGKLSCLSPPIVASLSLSLLAIFLVIAH